MVGQFSVKLFLATALEEYGGPVFSETVSGHRLGRLWWASDSVKPFLATALEGYGGAGVPVKLFLATAWEGYGGVSVSVISDCSFFSSRTRRSQQDLFVCGRYYLLHYMYDLNSAIVRNIIKKHISTKMLFDFNDQCG
jgi:hypothetical protein